jgi:hypothetical protein
MREKGKKKDSKSNKDKEMHIYWGEDGMLPLDHPS